MCGAPRRGLSLRALGRGRPVAALDNPGGCRALPPVASSAPRRASGSRGGRREVRRPVGQLASQIGIAGLPRWHPTDEERIDAVLRAARVGRGLRRGWVRSNERPRWRPGPRFPTASAGSSAPSRAERASSRSGHPVTTSGGSRRRMGASSRSSSSLHLRGSPRSRPPCSARGRRAADGCRGASRVVGGVGERLFGREEVQGSLDRIEPGSVD